MAGEVILQLDLKLGLRAELVAGEKDLRAKLEAGAEPVAGEEILWS